MLELKENYRKYSRPKLMLKLLVILMIISLILSGCQKAIPKGESGGEAPAVITVWHTLEGAEAETLQVQLQGLSKTKPEILVKTVYVPGQNLIARAYQAEAGGEGPEIFLAPRDILVQLYAQGALAPVVQVTSEAFPATVAQFRFDGILYAQPWLTDVPLLYFRKDNVQIPADLTSLMTTKGRLVLPNVNISLLSTWWNGQGGQLFEGGKPTIDNPANLTFLQQLISWRAANNLEISSDALGQFAGGQASYTIAWASQAQILTQLNVPWGSLPMSELLGGKGQALLSTTLGIANSAVKTIEPLNSAIQTVEKALLDPQFEGAVAQAGHRFPANSVYYSSADKQQGIEAQVEQVLTQTWPLEGSALEWKLFSLQDAAWLDAFAGMSPQDALTKAQNEAVKLVGAK
ncbi:MAG: sugar ABC transporter substrate-binding protein [Desulfitobacteriaceae bacterium]